MRSPKPPAPMNAAMVAVPTLITAEVLMPARIVGSASGSFNVNMLVVHDLRAQGQITERLLLFTAVNSAFAYVLLTLLLPFLHFEHQASWQQAFFHPLYLLWGSLVAGWLACILMGVFFAWLAYRSVNPQLAVNQVLDLFVQRTYGVMSNDVLIAIPLFLFMGYLVERAQLIDRLFHSLHLATSRVPGSLAVATIVTCAIFATATGIVGAVVTLMGLLAFPAMLKAGYNIKVGAGAITAGGCLGILIPPSVLLIVYGATAGVSVVQLYAGAFFPGFMSSVWRTSW